MRAPSGYDPRSFDHLPTTFDRFLTLVGGQLADYLSDLMPTHAGRAVDLGCGTGQHAAQLADRFDEVLAVDISEPMLALARQRRPAGNIRYEQRDLTAVTVERDGQFDFVFSSHALHHLPNLTTGLAQIRALTRTNGQVLLVDNVDPRRQAPRHWLRAEARKNLLLDIRRRRRPVREAVEVYRLATDPGLLDHFSTDTFLTEEDFSLIYGIAFPGAEFTPMYRAIGMHWRNRTTL
jgi:SAM-dependent methyltransferase